jgi:ubiquinone/menaquinone biosynthesis C-methylase UbiE
LGTDFGVAEKRRIYVEDAYALESPEDNVRLYADWAESYEADFVERHGYIYHQEVARQLVERFETPSSAILDVGCGTGVVGDALRKEGMTCIDGIDISAQMLAQAQKKKAGDGAPVYRNLIEADLTRPLDIADDQYAAIVSAGTFTHGHLGPEPLDELWRIAEPGAICVTGINEAHYESSGFAEKFSGAVAGGVITEPKLVPASIYADESPGREHGGVRALIVVCRTR